MPLLILLFAKNHEEIRGRRLIIIALLLSWIGDVVLLFEATSPNFFIAGLAAFLLAHISYILFFLSIQLPEPSLIRNKPILILPVIAYCIGLFLLLSPKLGLMKIPVLVYAITIGCMLLSCINVFKKLKVPSNFLFLAGALFFVLSDSILAIDKFYTEIPYAGAWIMLTYCLAQYLIVIGFLKKTDMVEEKTALII